MSQVRARALAPLLSAVLLCGLLGVRIWEYSPTVGVTEYMARVGAKIDEIPVRIGNYIGVDSEVTPGVIDLLQPNRILQRRYRDPETGESFSLVFVHCGIAKDMTGHYPPNCYPRAGWVEAAAKDTVSLEVQEITIPASRYHFQIERGGIPSTVDILSFFAVPAGPQHFGPDIRLVDKASRSPAASRLGAGQVQILTPQEMSEERRTEIWHAVLEALYPSLREITEGTP